MDSLPGKRGQLRIKSFLLLLNLFVARTLGDCSKPVLALNIVLTDEALLMNEFPDNVEISVKCVYGFVIDSGSGMMKCIDGTWSDPDLTCRKKDCGVPLSQPHMIFNLSQGTLFGASVTVSCEEGYRLTGSGFKHCYNAGWTGKNTKCEIITCDMPEEITNGRHSWDSDNPPKYGEKIDFYCNEGYALTGNNSIMCTDDGQYNLPAPQCLGIFTTEDNTTTTLSPTDPYHSQGNRNDDVVDTKKDVGYTPVIISVVCVSLAACIVVLFIHKLLLKRKGSYDTREDLKPELLQFQNL